MIIDNYVTAVMRSTANKFQLLASLRNVQCDIDIVQGNYVANGHNCGTSVHGLYEWLEKQPNVKS